MRAACRSAAWAAVRPRVSQRAEEEGVGVLVTPGDSALESVSAKSIRDKFILCLKCVKLSSQTAEFLQSTLKVYTRENSFSTQLQSFLARETFAQFLHSSRNTWPAILKTVFVSLW